VSTCLGRQGAKEGITYESAHNNLNHNFEFQSKNNVHELLHPSQLDFTHMLWHEKILLMNVK
jgi:hypothetical protein